jgi:L-arabinokinase
LNSILYYITGHGYGHAVRSCQVILSLKQASPDTEVHVRSTVPAWLFKDRRYRVKKTRQALDVGIVQSDSLHMGLRQTLDSCKALHARIPSLIQQEVAFVRKHNIQVILGDVPPLCFEIAAQAGVPSVAITNFSWSRIYRGFLGEYPDFLPLIEEMEKFYRKTTLTLGLPYPCGLDVFPSCQSIPLITRFSELNLQEARARLGLPASASIVLLSFGGLGLERLPLEKLRQQKEFFFVGTSKTPRRESNLLILPAVHRQYVDLLRAADVVVSKPGYGIVADIIRHQIPLLYTARGQFAEYPHLVEMLDDWATAEFIPQDELLAANLTPYLTRLFNRKKNWPPVSFSGASVAAEKILALL